MFNFLLDKTMENTTLFLSVFETSMPLLHRIIMKKLHDEDMDADESKLFVCWQITDAFEAVLTKEAVGILIEFIPGATDEFLDKIESFINDDYLLTFQQGKGGLDHWFTVLHTNDKVYSVESGGKDNITIKSSTKSEFLSWMRQLLNKDIEDNFYKKHVEEMAVFVNTRKTVSIDLIATYIAENMKLLSN